MRPPLLVALLGACGDRRDPAIERRFSDRFDRAELGADWRDTSGKWRIEDGTACAEGAHNHPLWLRRRLPRDVRIEISARSASPDGDLKVEVMGDGRSYATEDSYTATSYVLVFGGWHNRISTIARMNEHGEDRHTRTSPKVEPDRTYAFSIERRGRRLAWRIDGAPFLDMDDPEPLEGEGHDHFALNDWETPVCFDDLVVTPL
jgi:hypothetical protein